MEVEPELGSLDDELKNVLFTGKEYTQPGSVVSNCILLFGSNEGECTICTKPCLHPLSSADLQAYFSNDGIITFDWIDDTACIMVCKDALLASQIVQNFFHLVFTEESGIEWYKSKSRVLKQFETDEYGEKGKEIYIYARCCLTSDIEHKQKLHQAKIVTKIIKRRKEIKRRLEKQALKEEFKQNKKKKNRKKKQKQKQKQKKETEPKNTQ